MILADPAATEALGASLAALVRPGDAIALSGPLGAGKTSLARGLLAALGLEGEAPSPSFAIVQPYDPPETRLPVLHVDLYRIEDAREIDELGLDEARGDALLLVEWPERAPERFADALVLRLTIDEAGGRSLDSGGTAVMEGAMATDMTPPPGAAAFLAAHGWGGAAIVSLAGDASFRRYFRVTQAGRSAVLMDAPPPHENPRPFVAVAGWLTERGFAAPAIHARDMDRGLVLLEDFGDIRMRETVDADPSVTRRLYEAAVDLLVALHRHEPGDLPVYSADHYRREVALLTEWYCPAVDAWCDRSGYVAAWDAVLPAVLDATRRVVVLRDYHAENLMLVGPDQALGLLDFQDALAGHPAYDLVSLLQDARRDVEPEIEAAMLDRYRAATGAGEDFLAAYHVLGAQRNAKIIGIFTRLWQRDGKPRYAALCPRVWRYLERDLAHPALAEVRDWFDVSLPSDRRGDPMVIGGA